MMMKWGKDDCLTDILGEHAHTRMGWVKRFATHNRALAFVAALPPVDRWRLFTDTAKGQGWGLVEIAEPGDVAIGEFKPATGGDICLLNPWFAVMQVDYMWYVRMPHGYRAVVPYDAVEVFRCPQPQ